MCRFSFSVLPVIHPRLERELLQEIDGIDRNAPLTRSDRLLPSSRACCKRVYMPAGRFLTVFASTRACRMDNGGGADAVAVDPARLAGGPRPPHQRGRTTPDARMRAGCLHDADTERAGLNVQAFAQEVAWAAHLSCPAVVFPPPDALSINYAVALSHAIKLLSFSQIWVRVPLLAPVPPSVPDAVRPPPPMPLPACTPK